MITPGNRRQSSDAIEEPRDPELDDEETSIEDEEDELDEMEMDEPEDDTD